MGLPEKLTVLLGTGDTILSRLHKIKVATTQRKPSFLTEPQTAKAINGACKKFKDVEVCTPLFRFINFCFSYE